MLSTFMNTTLNTLRTKVFTPTSLLRNSPLFVRSFTEEVQNVSQPSSESKINQIVYKHTKPNEPETVSEETKFAVVSLSGTQYKVTTNDLLFTNHIPNVDIGQQINLKHVLLVGSKHETIVGVPYVQDATVTATVEQHFRDKKVVVFKKIRRTGYQRKHGFRRDVTALRIDSINIKMD
ncbi:hypothetical protein WA158_004729 [Blastocystis sp. Blastoise]